jgi:hypothetical protein
MTCIATLEKEEGRWVYLLEHYPSGKYNNLFFAFLVRKYIDFLYKKMKIKLTQ